MYRLDNTKIHKSEMAAGAAAFKRGAGICDGPHENSATATAWEAGWLNECQSAVLKMAAKPAKKEPAKE